MTVNKITNPPSIEKVVDKVNEVIDNLGGGGSSTDVQINGTSITSGGVANILTNTAYNASSNKIATMSDLPSTSGLANTDLSNLSSTGESHFLKSISSTMVINALGYTPYNSTNPNGYTSNIGTVTSVNNTSPDSNGNVTISIPSIADLANKDLSNLSTTGNAKFQVPLVSGTNIKTVNNQSLLGSGNITISGTGANTDLSNLTATGEAHFLKNTATGQYSVTLLGTPTNKVGSINIGYDAVASGNFSLAIGSSSTGGHCTQATGTRSIAIGTWAEALADGAIQIGYGSNSTENSLQVSFNPTTGSYILLNSSGKIPDDRLNTTIARTSQIPTESTVSGWGFTKNVGTVTDVKVNNTSVTSSGVANIPLAGTDTPGVAKANAAFGVYNNSGTLTISKATDSQVTAKTSQYRPLVPYNIDLAVKTGVTTNSLTLTSAEQTAAQNWLGVANTDLSNLSATGKGVIDGQWVGKYAHDVLSATAVNSYSYSISSYLPTRTNETYLIYGHMSVVSNNTTVFTVGKVASPYTNRTNNNSYAAVINTNTNSRTAQSTFILPIASTDTYIYAQITSSVASTGCYISLLGYRRIGTNT